MTKGRTARSWLKWTLGILAAVTLLVTLLIMSGGDRALRWLEQQALQRSGNKLHITGLNAALDGSIRISSLRYETDTLRIVADDIAFDWQPQLLVTQRRVHISALTAAKVVVTQKAISTQALQPPNTLQLPFSLEIQTAQVPHVRIDRIGQSYALEDVRLSLDQHDHQHQLRITHVTTPWGDATADLAIAQSKPFVLDAHAALSSGQVPAWAVQAHATGPLDRIKIELSGSAAQAQLQAQSVLLPFSRIPLGQTVMALSKIDPAQWHEGWPNANIDVTANFQPDETGALSGEIKARNAIPGSLDRQRLPLQNFSARLAGSLDRLLLQQARMDFGPAGQASGNAQLDATAVSAALTTNSFNLRGLHGKMIETHLQGNIKLGWNARVTTVLANLNQRGYQFQLDARQQGELITLKKMLISAGDGSLDLNGKLSIAGTGQFNAKGELRHFNPARFGDFPQAQLNAALSANGNLLGSRSLQGQFKLAESQWLGQPLAGSGTITVTRERLAQADVTLSLAENRLSLSGSLGAPADRLIVKLDAPNLARLGSGFAGKAVADGVILGTYTQPAGSFDATLTSLQWQLHRLDSARLSAKLPQGVDGPVTFSANLNRYRNGKIQVNEASVALDGSRAQHRITLKAQGENFIMQTTVAGNWHARTGWEEKIMTLTNSGRYPFELSEPAIMKIDEDGVILHETRMRFAEGIIALKQARYRNGEFLTEGGFSGVSASQIQHMAQLWEGTDFALKLGGSWSVRAGQQLDGTLDIRRESGDAIMLGDPKLPLGVNKLALHVGAQASRISAQLSAQGTQTGSIEARAETTVSRRGGTWGVDGNAPVRGSVRASMPTMAGIAPFLPPALLVSGSLQMQLEMNGVAAQPELSGSFDSGKLDIELPGQGIFLRDGQLHGKFRDDRLVILPSAFASGSGRITVSGDIQLNEISPAATLTVVAQQAEVLARPNRHVVISGEASITTQGKQIQVTSKARIDSALIQLARKDMPTLGDDVVLVGPDKVVHPKVKPLLPELDLDLDLGNEFFLKGRGLDARLTGALHVHSDKGGALTANGTIEAASGIYDAYGQHLEIDRGILAFTGPFDNPRLNVLAMRKNQPVEAGVSITGTALAPQVRVVSVPSVSEAETLSWLVLGHGLEGSSNTELGLVQTAAAALMATGQSITGKPGIAQSAGLDELGLKGNGNLEKTVVSLGKRLSSRTYVSYEQGMSGASSLVKINYTLSKNWSVRTQGGQNSGIDLFYTLSFE
ncbi:MAG: translocation/assembly module TamB domain-containing protein [Pseudomonadota bacterium]